MVIVNLKNYKFKCISCGNCCYNIVEKLNFNQLYKIYLYDYQGILSKEPKTSVTVHYLEKPRIESAIKERFNLKPKFFPFRVLFLRDFPIGFIYDYQLGVKKKKYCMFYDLKKRNCKIYPVRPTVCRSFPLKINPFDDEKPIINLNCTAIETELKKYVPNIEKLENIFFNNPEESMISIFTNEYKNFKKLVYWNKRIPIFFKIMKPIFLALDIVTPDRVKNYELDDMGNFLNWAKQNLDEKIYISKFNELKKKIKELKK